jgi:hypothetical protein
MRRTWLFQANPSKFDIDSFLATHPAEFTWLVTRYRREIMPGDQVFIWRSNNETTNEQGGVIAETAVIASATPLPDHPKPLPYWTDPSEAQGVRDQARLRLVRIAGKRTVLRRDWLKEDPILRDLTILKMANATNYEVLPEQAVRLNALWTKTGQDWSRAESVAGLWAYQQTFDRLPGSPVARVALLTGRAVGGVYNKVMNFRALDPRDGRAGMPASSAIDRQVWEEFFDPARGSILLQELQAEFQRLWGEGEEVRPPDEAEALGAIMAQEAERLTRLSLDDLMARYLAAQSIRPKRPIAKVGTTRAYERDPVVVAIAKLRADFKCEIPGCQYPTFVAADDHPYCEVYHIDPLAEGGEDTLDNVACMCPGHHSEAHHGKDASIIAGLLKKVRCNQPPKI